MLRVASDWCAMVSAFECVVVDKLEYEEEQPCDCIINF